MGKSIFLSLVSGLAFLGLMLSGTVRTAYAQQTNPTVSGVVVDNNNYPLPGVTVSVAGTTAGTVTNSQGEYSIRIKDAKTATLKFDCLGFESVEIPVAGNSRINVTMEESSEVLDELVVVGYGTIRKSDMVGSSATMKADHIAEMKTYSFEQAMQGRMAGVVVSGTSGEPGAAINITVRGASSINGSNRPLFVIDGVPMDNINTAAEYEGASGFNVMSLVNPNDIQSIEVLKDASSTAIYGSRGANGVVLVTTKQGRKGRAQVNANITHSISWSNRYFDLANVEEYAAFLDEGRNNTYSGSPRHFPELGFYYGNLYVPGSAEVGEGTDWQKMIRRVANSGNYQVSVSGGSGKTSYYVSGGASIEQGIILRNDYNKYNVRANFKTEATKWLDIDFTANGFFVDANRATNTTNQTAYTNVGRNGAVFKSLWASPLLPYDHKAYMEEAMLSAEEFGVTGTVNPYLDLLNETYKKKTYNINMNTSLIFKIISGLTFTLRGNTVYYRDSNKRSWNDQHVNSWRDGGYFTDASAETFKYGTEAFFNFNRKFGGHSINAAAGVSAERAKLESLFYDLKSYSVSFDEYEFKNAYAASVGSYATPSAGASERVLLSAYARVNYSYKDRYLVNFTVRGDGASVFAAKKKWAIFPSFGVGWNFANEPFMKGASNVITSGKIRFSYGTSGNQAIGPYGSLASLNSVKRTDSSGNVFMGFRVGSHPENPYLTWETTTQADLGFEIGLWKRVTLGVDIYRKRTDNLLQTITIPAQTGYSSYVGNMGTIQNKGVEIELGVNAFNTKDFFWDINATFTTNKGKILDLGSQEIIDYNAPTYGGTYTDPSHRIVVGGSIGDFFGLQTDGLLTQQDIDSGYPTYRGGNTPGRVKYVDQPDSETGKGDGMINLDGDGVVIGNANPDFVIGFGSNIGYKGFTLSFMFNAAVGQEILNINKLFSEFGNWQVGVPSKAYIKDHYSEDNKDAYYPIPGNNAGMAICDRLIEDGSFLRLSNLTLKYDLPRFKKYPAFRASVFVTGTNLFVLTKYSGYDPELSAYGTNVLRAGVDQGVYPRPSSVTFGVDLNF